MKTPSKSAALTQVALEKPAKPNHIKAAFPRRHPRVQPEEGPPGRGDGRHDIPEKFKRYYRLLIDLRTHLTEGIERHSEETLKRSAKEDSGDLSSYGQHMADAGPTPLTATSR